VTTTVTAGARRPSVLSWLGDRGVRARILATVLLAAAVGALVGVVGIAALGSTNAATTAMYAENVVGLQQAATLRRAMVQMRLDVTNHALSTDEAVMARFEDRIAASEAELRGAIAAYAALPGD